MKRYMGLLFCVFVLVFAGCMNKETANTNSSGSGNASGAVTPAGTPLTKLPAAVYNLTVEKHLSQGIIDFKAQINIKDFQKLDKVNEIVFKGPDADLVLSGQKASAEGKIFSSTLGINDEGMPAFSIQADDREPLDLSGILKDFTVKDDGGNVLRGVLEIGSENPGISVYGFKDFEGEEFGVTLRLKGASGGDDGKVLFTNVVKVKDGKISVDLSKDKTYGDFIKSPKETSYTGNATLEISHVQTLKGQLKISQEEAIDVDAKIVNYVDVKLP